VLLARQFHQGRKYALFFFQLLFGLLVDTALPAILLTLSFDLFSGDAPTLPLVRT
jgi:hypothetical protein